MNRFKKTLLTLLPKPLIRIVSSLRYFLTGDYLSTRRRLADLERAVALSALSQLNRQQNNDLPVLSGAPLNRNELRVYSQNGEDGILFDIFSKIGTTDRRFIEFGIGDGRQCNTANLSIHFGWSGLLIEADTVKAGLARAYYREQIRGPLERVTVREDRVTTGNINAILAAHDLQGEIDLLSIDIDGNDYWIWEAIDQVQPRVVVIEYNASLGPEKSITVPYQADFDRYRHHPSGYYHGASLRALEKLGKRKGYILAGCDSSGTNAFFILASAAIGKIDPVSVPEAYYPGAHRMAHSPSEAQFDAVKQLPFIEIQ